jgi:hypothetical protein
MHKPLAIFLLVACAALAFARDRESLDQLKARVESANPKDKVALALQVAERHKGGKSPDAAAAIQDVIGYTQKAADAASQSGKKLKEAEITVRKLAHKLADIKRSVDFNDQAPVQAAIDHMEKIRTQLLNKMFDLEKGKR